MQLFCIYFAGGWGGWMDTFEMCVLAVCTSVFIFHDHSVFLKPLHAGVCLKLSSLVIGQELVDA